ncbi:MAG: hypothetical protein Q4E41_06795 [Bacteroidales bacterium]|nr:hypothetical protein [Bacteroidales bacterium]
MTTFKAILFLFFLSLSINLTARNDGTTMAPILEKTKSLISYIEDEVNQEVVHAEMDILADTKTVFRSLQKGYTYQIIAYGDFRFKDIDVTVYRWNGDKWVMTVKDTENKDMAIVSIKPVTSSDYKIEVKAYKFNKGFDVGHYGLIICHEK